MAHETSGRTMKPPAEYREYQSISDKAMVEVIDEALTIHENASAVKRSTYINRQSRITKATRFFSRIPHPVNAGRELVLIHEQFQSVVPAGIATVTTNVGIATWKGKPTNPGSAVSAARRGVRPTIPPQAPASLLFQ